MKTLEERQPSDQSPRGRPFPVTLVKSLRPEQWIKNFFVVAPAVFAKDLFTTPTMARVLAGFIVFCGVSSATYLLNDVADRETDRQHPVKRHRPIAAGAMSVKTAVTWALVLIIAGLGSAFLIDALFAAAVFTYLVIAVAYSAYFKHVVILDVMFLAAGFVVRVGAGSLVARVDASEWLFLCTLLLALFLGFAKRRHELTLLETDAHTHRRVLEHYSSELLDHMLVIVATSTIVCYILYTVWPSTVEKFGTRHLIFTVPFVLYGIFRYFFIIHRRDMGGDPTSSLLTDRPLLMTVLLWGATAVGVIYFQV